MTNFNIPTLVTITAPTCAGKNYLLEAIVKNFGWNKILSTCTRDPRAGEVDGIDYQFISKAQSIHMEQAGLFAELVDYNGTRYGVTKKEMTKKFKAAVPPVVILEPSGLEQYRTYCAENGVSVFSIYISTKESTRIERLGARTTSDVIRASTYSMDSAEKIAKIIETNNKRLVAILDKERYWGTTNSWDLIVDGTNIDKTIDDIRQAVESRNNRAGVFK